MALTIKQTSTFSVPRNHNPSVRQAMFLAERAALNSMPDGPKAITVRSEEPDPANPEERVLLTIDVEAT